MNNENIKACIQAIMKGDYRYRCDNDDEISLLLNSLIEKLESEAKAQLGNTVSLSVEANETAIFSAQMLYNLQKVDQKAQTIAAAGEWSTPIFKSSFWFVMFAVVLV